MVRESGYNVIVEGLARPVGPHPGDRTSNQGYNFGGRAASVHLRQLGGLGSTVNSPSEVRPPNGFPIFLVLCIASPASLRNNVCMLFMSQKEIYR